MIGGILTDMTCTIISICFILHFLRINSTDSKFFLTFVLVVNIYCYPCSSPGWFRIIHLFNRNFHQQKIGKIIRFYPIMARTEDKVFEKSCYMICCIDTHFVSTHSCIDTHRWMLREVGNYILNCLTCP